MPHPATLEVSAETRGNILRAAGELLRAIVLQTPLPRLPDDVANVMVSGTFVSLKRHGHLRSCCGGLLGDGTPLGRMLADAAHNTALEDHRFPPISPSELPFLDVEVWLLFNPRKIEAQGEDRVQAVVTGGKHGLTITSSQGRGLLLPGVAAEHGWDSRTFLEQVCVKAGLHPSLWKEDAVQLSTFEGLAIGGKVTETPEPAGPPFLSAERLAQYNAFARQNLALLLDGYAPRYAAPGLPDGNVAGVILALPQEGRELPAQWSRLELHRGVPLQASLFQLVQQAAQASRERKPSAEELAGMYLTVLYDPAMHGSAADADLRGIDSARRAVFALGRQHFCLVFDPRKSPDDLLAEAVRRAEVRAPAGAGVFSFEANTTAPRVVFTSKPIATQGHSIRPPAVAGSFYPGDPGELKKVTLELLGDERGQETWPAAMVPHAGLRFSGRLAAAVLRRLKIPSTVIALGPKHTPHGCDWAIAPHQQWALPGVRLASDPALARELADAIPGLTLDAGAHQNEHGVEVELPFLAELNPATRVVGIALGTATLEDCRRFAEGLAKVVGRCVEPPLLLISSDMNHYASDAETRRLDTLALEALERLDPAGLLEVVRGNHVSMCGVIPAVIVLETLRLLGRLTKTERVGYATSADVTGDTSRVVGYAGMLIG